MFVVRCRLKPITRIGRVHRGTVSARVQATLKSSSRRKCTRGEDSSVVFQRESRTRPRRSHCPTCTHPNGRVTQNIWMWIWRIQKYNSETISTMDGVTVPGCFIRYVNRCKIVLRCSQASCRCVHRAIQLYDRNRAIRVNIYHFFFIFFGSICLLYCTTNYNICVFVETALFDRFFFLCKYFYGILKILIFEKNVLMKIFRIFWVLFVRLIINFFENL